MRVRRISSSRGFTLLEVLVAFLILSLSMSVLMRIVSQSLNSMAVAERHQVALQLAESKLAEVLINIDSHSRGQHRGNWTATTAGRARSSPTSSTTRKPASATASRPG